MSKYAIPLFICLILTSLIYSQKNNFSSGNRYYSTLQQWYSFAQTGDWVSADRLATRLDPADIAHYRSLYHPDELKKDINTLMLAPQKSVEDWIELARIQAILGKGSESLESLSRAHSLDLLRDDISRLYYQTKK
ncbi:MAG: hypothetical protein WAV41_00945 [Microgenomates group bacterium]